MLEPSVVVQDDLGIEFEASLEVFDILLDRLEQLDSEMEGIMEVWIMSEMQGLKCGSDKCRGGHEWIGEGELARLNIINCGVDIWRSDIELKTANLSLLESLKGLRRGGG